MTEDDTFAALKKTPLHVMITLCRNAKNYSTEFLVPHGWVNWNTLCEAWQLDILDRQRARREKLK